MQHVHHEVRVEAPVEHVWTFYCDPSNWPDYMPRARFLDFSGPVDEAGTTYVVAERFLGFESRMPMTVVEVEPLRLIHEHSDTGPIDNTVRFEPDGDATRFVIDSDHELPGRMPGFIKDLVSKGWVERQHRKMLADFHHTASSGPMPSSHTPLSGGRS